MVTLEQRWFEGFFDAMGQYAWILDERGMVIRANCAAQELAGAEPEGLVGVPLWTVTWQGLSRQNRRILRMAVNQAMAGNACSYELEFHRRGHPVTVLGFSFNPVTLEDGGLKFIIVEGRDISSYKSTTQALVQSEARFRTIFEQAEVGILIKGIHGEILDCNPAFQSLLGYTARELSRLDYMDITHPQDKRTNRRLFRELVSGKRKSYLVEKRYLHKDGHPIWVRVIASLVLESDHQAQFIIAMVENIQARKEIETELSELERRLMDGREMERLRIAQELHDGPLQELIDVSYQLHDLRSVDRDAAYAERLQKIQATVSELATSIRGVCGELRPPTLVPFGLGPTIRSHVEQFRSSHPEISVTLDLADDGQALPEQVRLALFRIYQAALTNVSRHAQASRVRIQFRLDEKQAVLRVRDNGKGFELPGRWIQLARQGHLGLVGARERAKEIGGNLKVTSRPGKGTTIQAVVPLCQDGIELPGGSEKS